ncbi:hypothetical protein BDF14DRAFT_1775825 [Spinellus fusiger]|nr:hypothetical protein BDF14DRAFT_1775825 [Spinellus fusiger]
MLTKILAPAFLLIASTYAVSCGKNHKASVSDCQAILDHWTLIDNISYSADGDTCVEKYNKYIGVVCVLSKSNSCALSVSISHITKGDARFGSDLKQFVQDSIKQCSSGNQVSASEGNSIDFYSQKACLSNSNSVLSC